MKGKGMVDCKLCGEKAVIKFCGQPGYWDPLTYDIAHCGCCGTAYALPLEVDSEIYDYIYRNSYRLPGYRRYVRYAERVLTEDDPLSYLEAAEDVYWAVGRYLEGVPLTAKLLEVGCGLGYLTYCISRRGYEVTGLDISETAVADASKKFGDLYVCADIFNYSAQKLGQYDEIIMTEVIEHLPDPAGFLAAAARLLRPGGNILVTTPNRSVYHKSVLWQSEVPPVHLWWFSERSLQRLADRTGLAVCFTNFSDYSAAHPLQQTCELSLSLPTRGPVLKADGELLSENEERAIIRGFQRNFFKKSLFKLTNQFTRFRDMTEDGSRHSIICAILTHKASRD